MYTFGRARKDFGILGDIAEMERPERITGRGDEFDFATVAKLISRIPPHRGKTLKRLFGENGINMADASNETSKLSPKPPIFGSNKEKNIYDKSLS